MGNMDVWAARRPPESASQLDRDHPADLPIPGAPLAPRVEPGGTRAPSRGRARRLLAVAGLVAVVAVTVAFAAMALLPAFGMRTMIVLSGSMAPAFEAGDAVVVRDTDPQEVQVGDVIAFTGYGTEHLTTHRVISLHEVKGELHFRTQGDANPGPDANLAPAGGLHGSVRAALPYAGRILAPMTGRTGKLVILGVPALVLVVGQVRTVLASASTTVGASRTAAALAAATVLVAATITGAAVLHATATFAQTHAAGDNTFRTGTFGSN